MRVLYVIDSLIGGGAEKSLAHMAPAYRELGLELHVAFLKSRWDVAEDLRAAGAVLHPVELDQPRRRQLRALVRLIRQVDPDVVHTTLWEADVLGRTGAALTRRPVVTTFANSYYSKAQFDNPAVSTVKLRGARLVDMITARFARRFHAVSEQVADDMARTMRVPRDRIVVVPRARRRELLGEPTAERRTAARARLGIDDDRPVVLGIARHEFQKGLDVLVAASNRLHSAQPDALVLIAGRRGRASEDLERQITEEGLADVVRLLGPRTDVPDLIVAADVVAVPSRVEGLPGAVLEAMALERPVVASDLPVVREAINGYAAALVGLGDDDALAVALAGALRDADPVRTSAARRRFDATFTPRPVVERLRAIYDEARSASRSARTAAT